MLPKILKKVKDHGFAVFESGKDYDLNIIGLRHPVRGRANELILAGIGCTILQGLQAQQ